MSDGWIVLGFVVTVGLPLAVIVGAIFWPQRIPPERSVDGIRGMHRGRGAPALRPPLARLNRR